MVSRHSFLRVQNFMVSQAGFGSGEGQSLERPFGHANPAELAAWAGATASWPNRTEPGGGRALDDYEWQGWWGDEPPFHTPVFVLTHHVRPSFTLSDTTFHFVDATPACRSRRAA